MKTDLELLMEGGAGGHMKHPFELNKIRTGEDLRQFFFLAADYLQTKPGATKIDGTNVSFKLVGQEDGRRQFAIDRGSLQEIDVDGVTIDRVSERFPSRKDPETGAVEQHGMVRMCSMTLQILNSALEEIQPELEAIGMWDNPSIYINAEFVEGTTNVTKYDFNFLALHAIQQFYQKNAATVTAKGKPTLKKPRPGLPRPVVTVVDDETGEERQEIDKKIKSKILTKQDGVDPKDLKLIVKKLRPFAEKFNFKVYSTIPTQIKKAETGTRDVSLEKNVKEALQETFTVQTSGNSITNTLEQWLAIMDSKGGTNSIPKLSMIPTPAGKVISPLSKACYLHIDATHGNGRPVEEMILGVGQAIDGEKDITRTAEKVEKDFNDAIFGAVVTEVTRVLGNAIMDGLQTEDGVMGDMSSHEGIVLDDPIFAGGGFVKITGQFIVDTAMGAGFGSKPVVIQEDEPLSPEEKGLDLSAETSPEIAAPKRRLVVYPGKFKPPHKGHLGVVEALSKHLSRPQDRVLVLVSPLSVQTPDGLEISPKDSKNIWELYLGSKNLLDKVEILVSPINSPVRAAYAILDNEVSGFETQPGDFVIPGASTKPDDKGAPDYERFARFHQYQPKVEGLTIGEAAEWAVDPICDDCGIDLSATDFRIAIDNKEDVSRWVPSGISEEMFYQALNTTGDAESSEISEASFQSRMKRRLKKAHKRLLDKGGQKNTAPFTSRRAKTSNAFLAKEEVEEIDEMSTAGGGAGGQPGNVEGGNGSTPKREDKPIYNVYDKPGVKAMSYEDFAEEVKTKRLRRTVRENLEWIRKDAIKKKRSDLLEKVKLQTLIQELIYEAAVEDVTSDPHKSTGLNSLDKLLKTIIPTIEEYYKMQTTEKEQRDSFRAHILHAIAGLLAPANATEEAGDTEASEPTDPLQEINIDIDAPDEEKFIDINKDQKEKEKDPVEEFGIEGEDETGRNAAYECMKQIEKAILKAFKLLGNDKDREMFFDYLLTNVKLYMDIFEKQLQDKLEEPTTPEYEQEKDRVDLNQGSPEPPQDSEQLGAVAE